MSRLNRALCEFPRSGLKEIVHVCATQTRSARAATPECVVVDDLGVGNRPTAFAVGRLAVLLRRQQEVGPGQELIARGLARAAQFTTERDAQRCLALAEILLAEQP